MCGDGRRAVRRRSRRRGSRPSRGPPDASGASPAGRAIARRCQKLDISEHIRQNKLARSPTRSLTSHICPKTLSWPPGVPIVPPKKTPRLYDVEPRQTVARAREPFPRRAGARGLVARPWRGGRGRARTASALGKGMRGPPGGLAVHREGVGRRPTGVSARRRGRARRETRGLARAARRARLAWRGSHRRSHPGNPRLVRRSPPRNAFPTPPPPPQAPRARS